MPPIAIPTVTLPSSELPFDARSFFSRSCSAALDHHRRRLCRADWAAQPRSYLLVHVGTAT
jgi:hypothetical protein